MKDKNEYTFTYILNSPTYTVEAHSMEEARKIADNLYIKEGYEFGELFDVEYDVWLGEEIIN